MPPSSISRNMSIRRILRLIGRGPRDRAAERRRGSTLRNGRSAIPGKLPDDVYDAVFDRLHAAIGMHSRPLTEATALVHGRRRGHTATIATTIKVGPLPQAVVAATQGPVPNEDPYLSNKPGRSQPHVCRSWLSSLLAISRVPSSAKVPPRGWSPPSAVALLARSPDTLQYA